MAEIVPSEEAECLSSVRTRVAQLYEVLHVDQHQLDAENRLLGQIEKLKEELEPLEKVFMHLFFFSTSFFYLPLDAFLIAVKF